MASKELFEHLKARFPDEIIERVEDRVEPYVKVKAQGLAKVCRYLKDDTEMAFNYLVCISGMDEPTKTLSAVYHLESFDPTLPPGAPGKIRHKAVLKVEVPRDNPIIDSVAGIWAGANWHEREAYDLIGVRFEGHPDLRRILTDDDWVGHPLRKDYVFPKEYRGIDLT